MTRTLGNYADKEVELPGEWIDDPTKACRTLTPKDFHPTPPGGVGWKQDKACEEIEDTRRVCFRCPVQLDCLDYSKKIPTRSVNGIWGGVFYGTGGLKNSTQRKGIFFMQLAADHKIQLPYQEAMNIAKR